MPYSEFKKIVTNGRKKEGSVMPAFAGDKNVMCYIDDIYTYLKARSDGVLARGRPPSRDEKPEVAKDHDRECFGG
jgi:hypothetical protein